MPYIKLKDRKKITPKVPNLGTVVDFQSITNPGELNYAITVLLKAYWKNSSENYQAINDMIGALEGAKLELYRRLAVPYEDDKIKTNGDVY